MTTTAQIAEVTDYPGLVAAFRLRAEQLQISRENIDSIAGWADNLAGKLLSPNPVKRIGLQTLQPMLAALGCKLLVVEDPYTTELYRRRRTLRNASQVRQQQPGNCKKARRSRTERSK
jgi:hypothetical protein